MPTANDCSLLWARTDLDAFLLFEAASRGDIPIYTEEPDVAERERLTRSGQVIIWDETAVLHLSSDSGKFVKTRWHHTVTWSASRMIRNYLVCTSELSEVVRKLLIRTAHSRLFRQTYRQMYPKKGPRHPRAKAPDVHDDDLEYDLFCAFRDHENFPAGGLMRRVRLSFDAVNSFGDIDAICALQTMSLKFNGHELHLINFYEPYSQIDPANRLPTSSSLPQFDKYVYQLSPGILRHEHRRPPVINVLRYTQKNSTTGATELVERPVYGGEWRAHAAMRDFHFNAGRKYWAEKLGIREEELDFFAENPLTPEGRAAGPEPFCHSLIGRNGKRKPRKKGVHRSAAAGAATPTKKKAPAKSKPTQHSPEENEDASGRQPRDDNREDPSWSPRSKPAPTRGRLWLPRRATHRSVTPQAIGPIRNNVASVTRPVPVASAAKRSQSPVPSPPLPATLSDPSSSDTTSSYSPTCSPTFSSSSDYATLPSPVEQNNQPSCGSSEDLYGEVGYERDTIEHYVEPAPMHPETIPAHQTVVYPDGTSITPYSMAANQYTQAGSSPTIQFTPSFDLSQHHGLVSMQPPPYNEVPFYHYSMSAVDAPCSPIPPSLPAIPLPSLHEHMLDANANNLLAVVYENLLNGANDVQPMPPPQPPPPMRSWMPENMMANRPPVTETFVPHGVHPFVASTAAPASAPAINLPTPPVRAMQHQQMRPSYDEYAAPIPTNPQKEWTSKGDWTWVSPQFPSHPHHNG